jgi:hypothetical protein
LKVSSVIASRHSETYRVQLAMYIDYTTHVIILVSDVAFCTAVAYCVLFDSFDEILAVYSTTRKEY